MPALGFRPVGYRVVREGRMKKPSQEFIDACRAIRNHGEGSIRKRDGTVVSGRYFDECSWVDDPAGVGYISLEDWGGSVVDVSANEFGKLV